MLQDKQMKFKRCRSINRNQRGFTLIELIVAVAITSLLTAGATMAIFQVFSQSSRSTDYMSASKHALNAVYWVSRDAQMAQTVNPDVTSGFPLVLSWVEWDNSSHQVTYTLTAGKLSRQYSIDGGVPSESVVAQFINSDNAMTTCGLSGGVVTLKITATLGEGSGATNVTKLRDITPRPGL
ncbi:type II secretion system protein J [Chloroflexota bacterium]